MKNGVAFRAMQFALWMHATQIRKYTGVPYTTHLAEVAGIVGSVARDLEVPADVVIATAWLHDVHEDQGASMTKIRNEFGELVAQGVWALSDIELGSRAERKAASRRRLANAPGWVQTIKCADLISNLSSIVQHDPIFAVGYLAEKRLLLEVLDEADPRLRSIASSLAAAA